MTGGNHPGCQAKLAGKGSQQTGTGRKKDSDIPRPEGRLLRHECVLEDPLPEAFGHISCLRIGVEGHDEDPLHGGCHHAHDGKEDDKKADREDHHRDTAGQKRCKDAEEPDNQDGAEDDPDGDRPHDALPPGLPEEGDRLLCCINHPFVLEDKDRDHEDRDQAPDPANDGNSDPTNETGTVLDGAEDDPDGSGDDRPYKDGPDVPDRVG